MLPESAIFSVVEQYNATKLNGPRSLPVALCLNERMDTPWNLAGRALLAEALHYHLKTQPDLTYNHKTMSIKALDKLIPTRIGAIQRSRSRERQPMIMRQQKAQVDRVYGRRKSVSQCIRTIHQLYTWSAI